MNNMLERRDFMWGIAANVLNVGLWAVILPLAVRFLSTAETALWLIFVVLANVGLLLELGFNPTLSRSYSYVFAGAQSLQAIGVDVASGPVDRQLLAELIHASRVVYRVIGVLTALLLWGAGTAYVLAVVPFSISRSYATYCWVLFSLSTVMTLFFGYPNALLLGKGDVRLSNQIIVCTRGLQLSISVFGLLGGGGLLFLCLATVVSSAVGRGLAYRLVRVELHQATQLKPSRAAVLNLVRILWHNASRYGLVMVGSFLISRANILIAGLLIGVVPAAGYNFAMQILVFAQSVATLPFNLLLPRLNRLWAQGCHEEARTIFGFSLVTAMGLFILAAFLFIALGPASLKVIKGNLVLPSTALLILLSAAFLLELNHGICANFLTTANNVPFVAASLSTGLAIVATAWLIAPHFGVAGLVLSMAIWQLIYNNWKWPCAAARMVGLSYPHLLLIGIRSLRSRSAKANPLINSSNL